jgi:hypothetical protein
MQPKLLRNRAMAQTHCGVRVEGVDVVLTIGKAEHRMEYALALKIATFLYYGAKVAKKAAGDESLQIIGIADLTDANLEEMKAQRSRDGTAVFSKAG